MSLVLGAQTLELLGTMLVSSVIVQRQVSIRQLAVWVVSFPENGQGRVSGFMVKDSEHDGV